MDVGLLNDIVVPLAANFIGGVLALLAVLAGVRYTDFYRRLARWEPWTKDLWNRRLDLYVQAEGVLQECKRAGLGLCLVASRKSGDAERQEALGRFQLAARRFDELHPSALLLFGGEALKQWAIASGSLGAMRIEFFAGLLEAEKWRPFLTSPTAFTDAARKDLAIGELDEQVRGAIAQLPDETNARTA